MTNIRGTIKNNPKMNEGAGCWPPPDLGQVPDGLGRESHQDCHRRRIRHHFPAVISARYTRRGRRWATLLKNCMLSLDYYLISIAVVQFQVDRHKRCDLCIFCFRQSMVYYSTTTVLLLLLLLQYYCTTTRSLNTQWIVVLIIENLKLSMLKGKYKKMLCYLKSMLLLGEKWGYLKLTLCPSTGCISHW